MHCNKKNNIKVTFFRLNNHNKYLFHFCIHSGYEQLSCPVTLQRSEVRTLIKTKKYLFHFKSKLGQKIKKSSR